MSSSSSSVPPSTQRNYHAQGFGRGAVYRVGMFNFITHDQCEAFPGPTVNIVIGPNGTGKSTLVKAICLACCGTPRDRANHTIDISKLVKQGKENDTCFVEVDLVTGPHTLTTVRRYLFAGKKNTSKFSIDGKETSMRDAKKLMDSLGIDVDNLCTLMPQERVGEFSHFKPIELLQNTLKCIDMCVDIKAPEEEKDPLRKREREGDGESEEDEKKPTPHTHTTRSHNPDNDEDCDIPVARRTLYDEQRALCDEEQSRDKVSRELDAHRATLNELVRERDSLTECVSLQRRRETVSQDRTLCELRLLQLEAEACATETETARHALQEAQRIYLDAKKALEPLDVEKRNAQRAFREIDSALDSGRTSHTALSNSLSDVRQEQEDCDMAVERASMAILSFAKDIEKKEKSLQRLKDEKRETQQQWENEREKCAEREREIADCDRRMRELRAKQEEAKDEAEREAEAVRACQTRLDTAQRALSNFQDPLARAKESLRSNYKYRDAMRLHDELQRETEKGTIKLRNAVYGPVVLHMAVRDAAVSAMVEQAVPTEKLAGFVVQCDEDARVLKALREKLRVRVNLYTVKQSEKSIFPRARTSAAVAQRLGVRGALCDEIDCVEPVRAFFCSAANLHTVLWARGVRVASQLDHTTLSALCESGAFRIFVHDLPTEETAQDRSGENSYVGIITEFSGKRSRYAPQSAPSTVTRNVTPRGDLSAHNAVSQEESEAQRERLRETARARERELGAARESAARVQQRVQHNVTQLEALRQEKNALVQENKRVDGLRAKAERLAQRIDELKRDLSQNNELAQRQREFADCVRALCESSTRVLLNTRKASDLRKHRCVANLLRTEAQLRLKRCEEELEKRENAVKQASSAVKQRERALQAAELSLTDKEREVEEKCKSLGDEEYVVNELFPRSVALCPESSVDAVRAKIAALSAEMREIVANPDVFARYEALCKACDAAQKELETRSQRLARESDSFEDRATRWRGLVEGVTEKLNRLFAKYMVAMRFEGEVRLSQPSHIRDYELVIMVAFRRESALCALSGERHSGGERAVSTAMFLLALQAMAMAPFRVVDEINQGMDERNERLVMDRVVSCCLGDEPSSSSAPSSSSSHMTPSSQLVQKQRQHSRSQYFVVTPKLLPACVSLRREGVTVLVVFNGAGVCDTLLSVSSLMERMRAARGLTNGHALSHSSHTTPSQAKRAAPSVKGRVIHILDSSSESESDLRSAKKMKK